MADVQKYFSNFHDAIKMDDENEILREKRYIIIDKLHDRIPKYFSEIDQDAPTFDHFNKGGYSMGLGVKPLNSDYDIDVGIVFDIDREDYPDPVVVKQWVLDALEGYTDSVKMKQPCVTVQYHLNGEPCYHVDLAIYSPNGSKLFLARGKPNSEAIQREWQEDDPKGLKKLIADRFSIKEERDQYRRVVRYLKRWKDFNFSSEGHAAPIGIGITVAAYMWFSPCCPIIDPFTGTRKDDDLLALKQWVSSMVANFSLTYFNGEWADRLIVKVPVAPYCDLFAKMSNVQMGNFKTKFIELRDILVDVGDREADPVKACEKLRNVFSNDFPVPEPADTAERKSPAIISSGASA